MITFNGKKLPDWVSVVGMDFESVSIDLLEHEAKRRIGNFDAGIDKGGIEVNLEIFIEPNGSLTIYEQADELKRFIKGDNWNVSELIFNEQPGKFYNARVDRGLDINDVFTHGETQITFYASDPKKYDVELSKTAQVVGEVAVNYDGLETTPVVIDVEFTQDTAKPFIKHVESGLEVALEGQFKTGDRLVVDTGNRSVLLNGNNIKNRLMFKSSWLILESGVNTFKLSNPDGVKNKFTVEFRKAD